MLALIPDYNYFLKGDKYSMLITDYYLIHSFIHLQFIQVYIQLICQRVNSRQKVEFKWVLSFYVVDITHKRQVYKHYFRLFLFIIFVISTIK